MLEIPKLKKRDIYERVAFFGPMGSGKSFLARVLIEHKNYMRVSLADKLKTLAYDLYGIQGKDGYARKLLQEFSDDVKKWDNDVFIKHMLYKIERIESEKYPPRLVCDDLRFKREGEILKQNNFLLIKVECDEEIRQKRLTTLYPNTSTDASKHISEQEFNLITPDYTINSSNTDAILEVLGLINGLENSISG